MILAVDIGNSNICIGGLDGMKVLFTARMVTRPRCTGDEYTAEQFKKDMTREALYALTDKRLKERQ